jgi:hypothetical protein
MAMSKATPEVIRRVRIGQYRKLLGDRCGPVLPDDEAGREYLLELFNLISLGTGGTEKMRFAAETIAPWMGANEVEELIDLTNRKPLYERTFNARELGERLRLTNAERERLRLWHFEPCDVTEEDLVEQRKAKRRSQQQERRRGQGIQTRAEYRTKRSISRQQPWKAEGISERAWYYRKAKAAHTLSAIAVGVKPDQRGDCSRSEAGKSTSASLTPTAIAARASKVSVQDRQCNGKDKQVERQNHKRERRSRDDTEAAETRKPEFSGLRVADLDRASDPYAAALNNRGANLEKRGGTEVLAHRLHGVGADLSHLTIASS